MNYKIYIAGKITGEPLAECMAKFKAAENKIRELGAIPINPFKLGIPLTATWHDAKPHCIKAIRQCDAILMLCDYVNSPGALEELDEAQRRKLEIFYEQFEGYEAIMDAIQIGVISAGY